jgi:hypothetical protein
VVSLLCGRATRSLKRQVLSLMAVQTSSDVYPTGSKEEVETTDAGGERDMGLKAPFY